MDGLEQDTALIRALVQHSGLSAAAVAKKAGVAATTVNRPFNGSATTRLGRKVIERLQAAFPDFGGWQASSGSEQRLPFRGAVQEPDDDLVEIDMINMAYGLGGTFIDNEAIEVEKVKFSRSWLRLYTHASPALLFTTDGVGDSMEPTISDHDVIIGDRGQNRLDQVKGDKIWACVFAGVGMVKRLRALPDGTVRIMSDNHLVRDEVATDGDLHIVGRVVAVVKRH